MFPSIERTCRTPRHNRANSSTFCRSWMAKTGFLSNRNQSNYGTSTQNYSLPKHGDPLGGGTEVPIRWVPVFCAEVKNEWSFTSSPPVHLLGVDKETFTLTPVQWCADSNKFCTSAPNICVSSAWNLRHVTVLAPRIFRRFLVFFLGGGGEEFAKPCHNAEKI